MGPDATSDPRDRRGQTVRLEAVVFDLDGVVRHYDRRHEAEIELRWGLAPGSLVATAFGGPLGHEFMIGSIDHDGFERGLAELLGRPGAAAEFVSMRAEVDPAAVELVRFVQDLMPVALLTNGSLRTRIELDDSGLGDAFHHVFNSAETGVPKPHPQAYRNVLDVLGTEASRTAFIDDHAPNVDGAHAVGLRAHRFTGLGDLTEFLRSHGVPVPRRS